ncbi:MAG: helix-turn-helix domain-containing protein [Dongiaceae bacterium]
MAKKSVSCPVETTLGILSGRWKVMIIHQLLEGTKRFNQLQRELAGITHRTLAKQLREMEEQGLIARHDYREIPPRVDYSLTPLGLTLRGILQAMHFWAEKHGDALPAPAGPRRASDARGGEPSAGARAARSVFGKSAGD